MTGLSTFRDRCLRAVTSLSILLMLTLACGDVAIALRAAADAPQGSAAASAQQNKTTDARQLPPHRWTRILYPPLSSAAPQGPVITVTISNAGVLGFRCNNNH
jgi:hypothetical protein